MRYCCLFLIVIFTHSIAAQVDIGGVPMGFSAKFKELFPQPTPTVRVEIGKQALNKPYDWKESFTIPIQADFSLKNSGQWIELPNGDRLWRLKIRIPNAHGLILMYDNFSLPVGSKLFVHSPDQKQVLGAYTQRNNTKSNRFLTGIIEGETAIIEYFEPKEVQGAGSLNIFRIDALRQPLNEGATGIGFGTSASCHTNINCELGSNWQDVKRGICRVMMVAEEGAFWCTANVMNNAREDGKPYLLSGFHCIEGITPQFDLWRFDFNYESPLCDDPTQDPNSQSLLGCEVRSQWEETDLLLVELLDAIPQSYQAFYVGWDANDAIPDESALIHHPFADIKKITLEQSNTKINNAEIAWIARDGNTIYKTPIAHHFRVTYNQGGAFQGGSSGGGLFDGNKRLVGQLHGGIVDTLCRSSTAYFGRFHKSWEGGGTPETRLRDWLDPDQTGALVLDGIENPAPDKKFFIRGTIQTNQNEGINDVELRLNEQLVTKTDFLGQYFIDNLLPNTDYTLAPFLDSDPTNGLTVLDLLAINKHLLNTAPFESIIQLIAADANNSKSLSVLDLIEIRNVTLNTKPNFNNNTSWRFLLRNARMGSIEGFNFEIEETAKWGNLEDNQIVDFIGIKVGDVNGSADVKE